MKNVLRFRVATCAAFLLCMATAIAARAQTFTTLVTFDGNNGNSPMSSPIQGTDGNFYGTTAFGNGSGGFLYRMTPAGKSTDIYTFNYEGVRPIGRLLLATDGNLYGTTFTGGTFAGCPPPYSCGTVFKVTLYGTFTTLHDFDYNDGGFPYAGLIQAIDGNFYGTTEIGGTNGFGTIFKITSSGTFTTVYNFCSQSNCTDGASPYGGLIQANDGNFYSTTSSGGLNNQGTIFKLTPTGALTTLYNFCSQPSCVDGATPYRGLIQASDGNFYGTTGAGGTVNVGTAFVMTPAGTLTTLHSFCSSACLEGYAPSGLTQGTNGNFYGTTQGGANGGGTIYEMTPTGVMKILYTFDRATEAYESTDAPVQGTDGIFYGTTAYGGVAYGENGSVFSLSVGLGPFVETLPTLGKVGAAVIILGNGLTGTTSVSFNGTAATFTVPSPTEIKTTVPTGAASGKVQVTTPHGTLTSNLVFRVK